MSGAESCEVSCGGIRANRPRNTAASPGPPSPSSAVCRSCRAGYPDLIVDCELRRTVRVGRSSGGNTAGQPSDDGCYSEDKRLDSIGCFLVKCPELLRASSPHPYVESPPVRFDRSPVPIGAIRGFIIPCGSRRVGRLSSRGARVTSRRTTPRSRARGRCRRAPPDRRG